MLNTRPVSSKSALGAAPKILSSKIAEISAPRAGVEMWNLRAAMDVAGSAARQTWNDIYHLILRLRFLEIQWIFGKSSGMKENKIIS